METADKQTIAAQDQPAPIATKPRKAKGGQIGHKGGNQWTKRREAKDAQDNAKHWQENPRYTVAALMRKLEAITDGKIVRSPVQVKALELMLDRVAPRLSAVEQTTIEPAARLSESEIRAQLADLVANHSGVLQELIAEHARKAAQSVTAAVNAQSDSTEALQVIDSKSQAHG